MLVSDEAVDQGYSAAADPSGERPSRTVLAAHPGRPNERRYRVIRASILSGPALFRAQPHAYWRCAAGAHDPTASRIADARRS
jgi:hypothetical protein